MARILLCDPDQNHADILVSALEGNGHKLTICASRREAFNQLKATLAQFNVIILDFSNQPEDWEFLDEIRGLTVTCVPEPGILCLAKAQWKSDVKMRVERKGARYLYVRSA